MFSIKVATKGKRGKCLLRRPILPIGKFACKKCGCGAFNVVSRSRFEPLIIIICTRCLRKIEVGDLHAKSDSV